MVDWATTRESEKSKKHTCISFAPGHNPAVDSPPVVAHDPVEMHVPSFPPALHVAGEDDGGGSVVGGGGSSAGGGGLVQH